MRRGLAVVALVCAAAGVARAQEDVHQKPAISVERFTPPPGPTAFLGADDPDVVPDGAWALDAGVSYAARPIVLRDLLTERKVLENLTAAGPSRGAPAQRAAKSP
jgi:hypothetical protein